MLHTSFFRKITNQLERQEETKEKGFHIKIDTNKYNVPNEVKAYHAGFKHMREIIAYP